MSRPLVYSTEQRRQQYETLRNAGLSRADYSSAIRRLNQQETKYRAAQKVKERKQKEQDKRVKAEQLARALAQAKSRAEKEKQAKINKREKRREDAIRNREISFSNEIKSNMDNRVSKTYELSQAAKVFDKDADIKLLELIVKNSFNGMWYIKVNDVNYNINDNTRNKLIESIKKALVREEANTESDGRVVTEIVRADRITVVALEPKYKNRKRNDGFFKYHSKTNIDLSRYGIWAETVVSNYDDTCLLVALRNGGLSVK